MGAESAKPTVSAEKSIYAQKLKIHIENRRLKIKAASGENVDTVLEDGKFTAVLEGDTVTISDAANAKGTKIDVNDGGLQTEERKALGMSSNNGLYDAYAHDCRLKEEYKEDEASKAPDKAILSLEEFDKLEKDVERFGKIFGYSKEEAWKLYTTSKLGRCDFDSAEKTSSTYQKQYEEYKPASGAKTYEGFLRDKKMATNNNPVLAGLPNNSTPVTGTQHVLKTLYERGQTDFTLEAIDKKLVELNTAETAQPARPPQGQPVQPENHTAAPSPESAKPETSPAKPAQAGETPKTQPVKPYSESGNEVFSAYRRLNLGGDVPEERFKLQPSSTFGYEIDGTKAE